MKVLVIGCNGMLGRYVYQYLSESGHEVVGLTRTGVDLTDYDTYSKPESILNEQLKWAEFVVNCAGAIKPVIDKIGTHAAFMTNTVFPQYLARTHGRVIHITTDCVYDGTLDVLFSHNERDTELQNSRDVYGFSKLLGEPSNCLVIRTSIIGEELENGRSLLEWVKSKKGEEVSGFTNHWWNGVTCLQLAKMIERIVTYNDIHWGTFHLFTKNCVTKSELVQMISDVYNLNLTVKPVEASKPCNRLLSTTKDTYKHLLVNIPPLKSQIIEMRNYRLEK